MTKIDARAFLRGGVAALLLGSSVPLFADPVPEAAEFSVATHDIDLTSPAGVEKLHRRVASTIRWACGPIVNWTPASIRAMAECRAEAAAAVEPMVRQALANGTSKLASN